MSQQSDESFAVPTSQPACFERGDERCCVRRRSERLANRRSPSYPLPDPHNALTSTSCPSEVSRETLDEPSVLDSACDERHSTTGSGCDQASDKHQDECEDEEGEEEEQSIEESENGSEDGPVLVYVDNMYRLSKWDRAQSYAWCGTQIFFGLWIIALIIMMQKTLEEQQVLLIRV